MTNQTETLGQRIRKAREAADMTQKELAGRVGLSLTTIGKLEGDAWDARYTKLIELSVALDRTLVYLLFGNRNWWLRLCDFWPPLTRVAHMRLWVPTGSEEAKEADDGQADAD